MDFLFLEITPVPLPIGDKVLSDLVIHEISPLVYYVIPNTAYTLIFTHTDTYTIYIYIYIYGEMINFCESDKILKISRKVDKSNSYNGPSGNISLVTEELYQTNHFFKVFQKNSKNV